MEQRRVVTVAVMLGMFLAALDTTIVATALPTIARVLGGLELYAWVVASYSLTLTAATPLFGGLADRYGRRPVYLLGVATFLAGSALCGAARSMPELVLFRAVQGVGGGALLPVAITIVGDLFSLEERARVQGLFSGVWGVASVVGPSLGGFLVDRGSWRWIFYANLPLGLVTLWVVARKYREPPVRVEGRVDVVGAALLVACVVVGLWSLERASSAPGLVLSGLLAAAFVAWESRSPHPVVPLRLFRNRLVSAASVTGFLVGAALFGSLYYVPLFVQGVQGRGPTEAGAVLTPLMLAWTAASSLGGRLALRFGFRRVAVAGGVLLVAGFTVLVGMPAAASAAPVGWATALLGTGMGLVVLVTVLAVQSSVPYTERGLATSLTLFFRSIGGAVGVSVLGSLMVRRLWAAGVEVGQLRGLLDPVERLALGPEVLEPLRVHLAAGLEVVFTASLVLSGLALLSLRAFPAGPVSESAGGPVGEAAD
ncbi:MAG: MDR family MFS transporter [Armatimonadota bacterium]|nr:MDR family MFS transporter [Armatimonadota bacterium]